MPRLARFVVPRHPHHVVQRGVRSMDIFRDDPEREESLALAVGWAHRRYTRERNLSPVDHVTSEPFVRLPPICAGPMPSPKGSQPSNS